MSEHGIIGYIDVPKDQDFIGIDVIKRCTLYTLPMDGKYILKRRSKDFDLTENNIDIKDSYVDELNKLSIVALEAAREKGYKDLRLTYSYHQDKFDYHFVVSVIEKVDQVTA